MLAARYDRRLPPSDATHIGYPSLAFGMGIVLGLEHEDLGVAASMATHFAFDTTALLLVRPLLPLRWTA